MEFLRYISRLIDDPLISDKMILLAGPRQVGKTTVSKRWLADVNNEKLYYNWDNERIRRLYRKDALFFESELRNSGAKSRIVFDEIHKMKNWKTLLKGYYDTLGKEFNFLVTGSARLELFQRSGDSMLGRYHLLHLWPLTISEVLNDKALPNKQFEENIEFLEKKPISQDSIDALLAFSGFPEPFIKNSERALSLWHKEYFQRLIREDLRDLSRISDLSRVEHFVELLREKISLPLSLNSLREDIMCSYGSLKCILNALVKLGVLILIKPYARKISNALKKEPKAYFYDWTQSKDPGARFENFVAIELMSFCEYINDGGFRNLELFYVRDKQKREVDFLITDNKKPICLIEAKVSKSEFNKNLEYFSQQFNDILSIQVIQNQGVFIKHADRIWSVSANRFFNLFWV